jgi:hypothetical protein
MPSQTDYLKQKKQPEVGLGNGFLPTPKQALTKTIGNQQVNLPKPTISASNTILDKTNPLQPQATTGLASIGQKAYEPGASASNVLNVSTSTGGKGAVQFSDGRGLGANQLSGLSNQLAFNASPQGKATFARDAQNTANSLAMYGNPYEDKGQSLNPIIQQLQAQALNGGNTRTMGLGQYIDANRQQKNAQDLLPQLINAENNSNNAQLDYKASLAKTNYDAQNNAARFGLEADKLALEENKLNQNEYDVKTDPVTGIASQVAKKGPAADQEFQISEKLKRLQPVLDNKEANPAYQEIVNRLQGQGIVDEQQLLTQAEQYFKEYMLSQY